MSSLQEPTQVWLLIELACGMIAIFIVLICILNKSNASKGKTSEAISQSGKMYNSSMARELAQRGFDVATIIPEIEEELNHPVFAQVHSGPFASKANFYITRNWIIGYRISMQKTAVRICDMVRVSEDKIPNFKGPDYYILNVIDKNGTEFNFYMLDEACRKAAFLYIANKIFGDEGMD